MVMVVVFMRWWKMMYDVENMCCGNQKGSDVTRRKPQDVSVTVTVELLNWARPLLS